MADSVVEAKGFEPMTPCVQGTTHNININSSCNLGVFITPCFSAALGLLVTTISDPIHEAIYG